MRKKRFGVNFLVAATAAAGLAAVVGLGVFWVSANVFESYGWTLFVALPAVQGFLAVWLTRGCELGSIGEAIAPASFSLLVSAMGMMVFLWEGAVCIVMAAPLALPLAWLGAVLAYGVRSTSWMEWSSSSLCSLTAVALTLTAYGESQVLPEPAIFPVSTSLEIEAPPEDVWRQVISVSQLPEPRNGSSRRASPIPSGLN